MIKPHLSTIGQALMLTITLTLLLGLESSPAMNSKTNPEQRTVTITNVLSSKETLQVHCKEKHRDLGSHLLGFGDMYEFTFEKETFVSRLFFCGFMWSEFHWFDIYVEKRDTKTCGTDCEWQVHEYGPCVVLDKEQPWIRCYPWNRGLRS